MLLDSQHQHTALFYDDDGKEKTKTCMYTQHQWVYPDAYHPNINRICASGIHYFNHWLAAYMYESSTDDEMCSYFCVFFGDDGIVLYLRRSNFPSHDPGYIKEQLKKEFNIVNIVCLKDC